MVSQGKELCCGYSNDKVKAVFETPVIVFGDHTRNVKFIDFAFVPGADGIKVMKSAILEPKYLYYSVLYASFRIQNRGYNRHFALLKEVNIPVPSISKQIEIKDALDFLFLKLDQINAF